MGQLREMEGTAEMGERVCSLKASVEHSNGLCSLSAGNWTK